MDIPISALVAGFLVSTVGFSFFLYGKKQARVPQLVLGVLLMLLPFVVPSALGITAIALAAIGGLWLMVQAGH